MSHNFKIAILVSGNGSNLQVLIDKIQAGELPVHIVGVISNKKDAYALERAKTANISTAIIDKDSDGNRYTRQGFEQKALAQLQIWQPDLIVLAGFMRILTPDFIHCVPCPMINLHPSLLPLYKGLDTHRRVLQAGERYHGCSVHLVTAALDAGEVIAQAVTPMLQNDTLDSLQNRVHTLEHQLLPFVVGLFAKHLLVIQGGILENHLGIKLPLRLVI